MTAMVKTSIITEAGGKMYPLDQPLYCQYANGTYASHSHVVDLPMKIQGTHIRVRALVVDNCPHDIILGDGWLHESQAEINYPRKTITIILDGGRHTFHGNPTKADEEVADSSSAAVEVEFAETKGNFLDQSPKAFAKTLASGKVRDCIIMSVQYSPHTPDVVCFSATPIVQTEQQADEATTTRLKAAVKDLSLIHI